jgi:hypothetical protein
VTAVVLVLTAAALMLLAGREKKRLVFGGPRRCRRCRRELQYCSCPQRHRR